MAIPSATGNRPSRGLICCVTAVAAHGPSTARSRRRCPRQLESHREFYEDEGATLRVPINRPMSLALPRSGSSRGQSSGINHQVDDTTWSLSNSATALPWGCGPFASSEPIHALCKIPYGAPYNDKGVINLNSPQNWRNCRHFNFPN